MGLNVIYFNLYQQITASFSRSVRAMCQLYVYWCSFLPRHLLVTAKSASQQRAMRSPLFVRLGRRAGRWSFSRWTVFCPSGARGHAVTPVRKREWVSWCPTGDGWSRGQRHITWCVFTCSDELNWYFGLPCDCEFSTRQNMKLSI